jgi:8-oxo-dGTP pyrophosphatase MutT (NUDIX family)
VPRLPAAAGCKTQGEHQTAPRPPMQSREAASPCARSGGAPQVLLEQRPASLTVMPGLWELPALKETAIPSE